MLLCILRTHCHPADMAGAHLYPLLLLAALMPPGSLALERRFSELKRCADPECSMLMVRGKALKDFTGPDCRFVNFKKDELIYVYHKLDGRVTDLWAGSVGITFGYFPKDLLDIKQVYFTKDKEIQLPTDEADFVCFEGGTDNFDNYNVDELLNKPKDSTFGKEDLEKSAQLGDQPTLEASKKSEDEERAQEEEAKETLTNKVEERVDLDDTLEKDVNAIPASDTPEGSTTPLAGTDLNVEENSVNVNSQTKHSQEENVALQPSEDVILDKPHVPDDVHAYNGSISQEQSAASSEQARLDAYTLVDKDMLQGLKTSVGSYDDAVVSDDEETKSVTRDNGNIEEVFDEPGESTREELTENTGQPPLLPYEETDVKPVDQTGLFENESVPPAQSKGKPVPPEEEVNVGADVGHAKPLKPEENILTSWGDTFFAIVSGGEHTKDVTDPDGTYSEEDDEEDDENLETPDVTDSDYIHLLGMDRDGVKQYENDEPLANTEDLILHDLKDELETPADINNRESLQIKQNIDSTANASAERKMDIPSNDSTLSVMKSDIDPEVLKEKEEQETSKLPLGMTGENSFKDEASVNVAEVKESKDVDGEPHESEETKHQVGSEEFGNATETEKYDAKEEMAPEIEDRDDNPLTGKVQTISTDKLPSELEESLLQTADTDARRGAGADNIKLVSVDTLVQDKDKSVIFPTTEELPAPDENKSVIAPTTEELSSGSEKLNSNKLLLDKEDKDSKSLKTKPGSVDETDKSVNAPPVDFLPTVSTVADSEELEKPKEDKSDQTKTDVDSADKALSDGDKPTSVPSADEMEKPMDEPEKIDEEDVIEKTDQESRSQQGALTQESEKQFKPPVELTSEKKDFSSANNTESQPEPLKTEERSNTESEQNKLEINDPKVNPEDTTNSPSSDDDDHTALKGEKIQPGSSHAIGDDKESFDGQQELLEDENARNAIISKMENPESHIRDTEQSRKTEESTNLANDDDEPVQEEIIKEAKEQNEEVSLQKSSSDDKGDEPLQSGQENIKGDAIPEENSQNQVIDHLTENEDLSETDKDILSASSTPEQYTSYIDGIKELSIMKEYLDEDHIEQFRNYLTSENVFRVEAMFHDMEEELKRARQDNIRIDNIDKILDQILETAETNILDFIEEVLDQREVNAEDVDVMEKEMYDEEAMLLEDAQEVAYKLRQKYLTASDSSFLEPEVEDPEPEKHGEEEDKSMQNTSDSKVSDSESKENVNKEDMVEASDTKKVPLKEAEIKEAGSTKMPHTEVSIEEDDTAKIPHLEVITGEKDDNVRISHLKGTKEEENDAARMPHVEGTKEEENDTARMPHVEGTKEEENDTARMPHVEGTKEEENDTARMPHVEGTKEEENDTARMPHVEGTKEEENDTARMPHVEGTKEEENDTARMPHVEGTKEEEPDNAKMPHVEGTKEEEPDNATLTQESQEEEETSMTNIPQVETNKRQSDATGDLVEVPHFVDKERDNTDTVEETNVEDKSEPPFNVEMVHTTPTMSSTSKVDSAVSEPNALNEEPKALNEEPNALNEEPKALNEEPKALNEEPNALNEEDTPADTDTKNEEDQGKEKENPDTTISVSTIVSSVEHAFLTTKQSLSPFAGALISALPEDLQPGPDFHGVQWEVMISTLLVGVITIVVFFWRTCLSVKSRMYQVNEKQLAEKIANLMKEKSEALEKISEYEKKVKETKATETSARQKNTELLKETKALKVTIKELNKNNKALDTKMRSILNELERQKEDNKKKQEMLYNGQKSIKRLEEQFEQHTVELSEFQIALNEAKLKEQKVRSNLHGIQEENARLKERKEQLLKEAEGWSERQRELDEQIQLQQKSHKEMEEALAYKENEIEVLTNCIMQLKQFEEDSAADEGNWQQAGDGDLINGELPEKRKDKMKMQIKQMMDVSRVKTTLSITEEEKDLYQRKLCDEISARHELEEQIKQLQHDGSTLQSDKTRLDNECKTLRQKVEILTELYQQKEMALQKKLTQEEYERQEKEQKLSVADEKAIHASEEVKIYKQRILEMEEELQKTERSFKNQIASHEKKAHENWLTARTAERTLSEEKRECANLRQKLSEVNQRVAALQRPSIVKPTPGRPDHQQSGRRGASSRDGSYGPSPVSGGAPSPPMMMEGPGRSSSANLSRSDSVKGGMDVPPGSRRPPHEMSGRTSAPVELGHTAGVLNSGPRTSSPSMTVDGMPNPPTESEASGLSRSPLSEEPRDLIPGSKGPPSFPGTPVMNSPMLQNPGRLAGPPPPRMPFGPRPMPPPQMHVPPPAMRDFPPRPLVPPGPIPPDPRSFRGPLGPREYLPGPIPFHGPRDYPLPPPGVRDFPLGLPPTVARDFPPVLPPPGARDFPPGPLPMLPREFPVRPPPTGVREIRPGLPPPGARDFPPGMHPPGAREFLPGPPLSGARDFRAGPPVPISRENLPGPPPPGARDFLHGPLPAHVRDFPPRPYLGSIQGPPGPEHQVISSGPQQPSLMDNEHVDSQNV